MRKFLGIALACGIAACVKKPEIKKPEISINVVEGERAQTCAQLRKQLKNVLKDPERPWTDDLSFLIDELLVNCVDVRDEMIDALRVLLAKKIQSKVRPETPPAPPPSPKQLPAPTCVELMRNLPTRCGVPLFGELVKKCGSQVRRGVGMVDIIETSIPVVRDIREPAYEISCSGHESDIPGITTHSLEITKEVFVPGEGWRKIEGWSFFENSIGANFVKNPTVPHRLTNFRVTPQCYWAHDIEFGTLKVCPDSDVERLTEDLCPDAPRR